MKNKKICLTKIVLTEYTERMVKIIDSKEEKKLPSELLKGKRHLTDYEISILEKNLNYNEDSSWSNFYVESGEANFDPSLIHLSFFYGFIILGKMTKKQLQYNDLLLEAGIKNSHLCNVVIGDDCAVRNVAYLDNYRIGDRNILFNIQEMSCTVHSKFGNGFLKSGESEDFRVWIGVANENDGRRVLAFENMLPSDAYLWSHYRDDDKLLQRFFELTERENNPNVSTYGIIGNDCVIKNSNVIKDVKIGDAAYIKGSAKLKNITILSSEQEPTQIGEGVELVNGILGYGCHIFYQAIAVRFVIGRNCQVKYGARLLNSVLGDNSTISCCEVLNNLIFPFHEQHHNSSFLIATTIMGQSNIAAGATIGSNHNSRSPDGEIFAKRGFWPGLCSDFKHNSKFASFVLVSKGSYQYELDIKYPFSLVAQNFNGSQKINIIPAWWFMYDMFAITRNNYKFIKRDKRKIKMQTIETDPLAPDTMQEIMFALNRIILLTSDYLQKIKNEYIQNADTDEKKYQVAKDFLHKNPEADFTLDDPVCQKKYGAVIFKPVQAYKMYRKIVKYFCVRTLIDFSKKLKCEHFTNDLIFKIKKIPLYTQWENIGGQIIPAEKIKELFCDIKNGSVSSWDDVHNFYKKCDCDYEQYKVRYALYLLGELYSCPIEDFSAQLYCDLNNDVTVVAYDIYNDSLKSREKDYSDYYRNMTYKNTEEMEKVVGSLKDNSFLQTLRVDTEDFINSLKTFFKN